MAEFPEKHEVPSADGTDELKCRSKAKIRTIRIWLWVTALLFAGFFFLSTCAMTKPQFKAKVVESCIKNVPLTDKWQSDLKARGLSDSSGRLVADYCLCMWEKPLDKLNPKQIEAFGSMSAQEQLDLLGGAAAFEERDRQCVSDLKE
ncbi:MAG: hypothetical protein Q4A49_04665 [Neisseria sp.]|nr:hypothetical protein [Neisseria sp.]